MKYIDRDGRFFVSALELEIHAEIAVKPLPGRSELVACRAERCILVDRQELGGDKVWISLDQIAEGFGARWSADESRNVARLEFDGGIVGDSASPDDVPVGVLAPSMRFPLLGGGAMSLDEFRGERVLMNRWARESRPRPSNSAVLPRRTARVEL